MKIDKTVKKETGYIALGQAVMTVLMLAVFLIIGKFRLPVLFGALLSSAFAVLNFFLLGLTVQKALENPEIPKDTDENGEEKEFDIPESRMKGIIKLSQSGRLLLTAAVIIIGVAVLKLDMIAMILPVFFPRITIMIRGMALKSENSDK